MKTQSSANTARVALGIPFLLVAIFLAVAGLTNLSAKNRAGTKGAIPQAALPQTFTGTFDPNVYPCGSQLHPFVVPPGQARIVVQANANFPSNDITVTLLYGAGASPTFVTSTDTGVGQEVINYAPAAGVAAGTYQVQVCVSPNPAAPLQQPYTYTGIFTYDDTGATGNNPPNTGPLPAPPQDAGPKVGYEWFQPPGILTPVLITSSGGKTVEYLGRYAIEPSIGANWSTGTTIYQSDLETLFVTFDDSCNLANPKATWVNRPATLSAFVDSDPILFTDHQTNRTFVSELTLLSPDTSKISFTDSDGLPTQTAPTGWTLDQQAQGLASAVDHQTIGGGPYNLNAIPPPVPSPTYPNAVYYCSQDIATAFCSRSDNGGTVFGNQVPLYTLASCGGLHGHAKVSPADGSVYVPNRDCNGLQSIVVSTDNGVTWTVKQVNTGTNAAGPSNVGQGDDPACSIDAAGRVYFAFSHNANQAGVAWSDDHGDHWFDMYDLGATYGLKNICFPTATAGDAGRAAIAFYGSTTPEGPNVTSNDETFTGLWHLYVAHTFDGGKSWTTSDVTPTLPMQRSGILRGGGADAWRNLADFMDMTIDRDGRVLVGFGNGCDGGDCAQAPTNPDGTIAVKGNAYTTTASIARQSSGRRMLKAKDPANVLTLSTVPGMPLVQERRIGNVVKLAWNEGDSGNSMINSYSIYRGTAPGAEGPSPIATVSGTQTGGTYTDTTATDLTKTYYYRVAANNSIGSSCGNNEVAAPYKGDTCTGLIIHRNDPTHPESTGAGTAGQPPIPALLIDYISLGEPPGTSDLTFKMKVGDLTSVPKNSRWRIAWTWYHPNGTPSPDQLYYIGMKSDANSNVTFEYGTLADAGVPAVLVLGETPIGIPVANYTPDGTITMTVARSAVGNPQIGDMLAAVGGKTITGDTPATEKLERSTTFVDHTFIKGTSDSAFPAATYTVVGGTTCATGTIVPVGAVSRKTHGSAGTFDVDLPLIGTPGIESRSTGGNHQVVISFAAPILAVQSANVTPGTNGTGSVSGPPVISGNQVTVNLTGVSTAQTLSINLVGVSDGSHSGTVTIPMSVLVGDVNASGNVDSADVGLTQRQNNQPVTFSNFRSDENASGNIDAADVGIVQRQNQAHLP